MVRWSLEMRMDWRWIVEVGLRPRVMVSLVIEMAGGKDQQVLAGSSKNDGDVTFGLRGGSGDAKRAIGRRHDERLRRV